jgi:hypothetical protein
MHKTGGGFKLSILDKYLRTNFAEMNIEDANLERTAGYLKLQSRDSKFINIVQKCALHIILPSKVISCGAQKRRLLAQLRVTANASRGQAATTTVVRHLT